MRAWELIWHQPRQKRRGTRAVAGDWRRAGWVMSLSARFSLRQSLRRHLSCRTVHPGGASGGRMSRDQKFGWDTLALSGVQFEATVVQSSWKASKGHLCGFVGAANRPVVEEETRQISSDVDGLTLRSSFRDAQARPRAKRSGPRGPLCRTALLLGIFSGPNKTCRSNSTSRSI